jgi:microcin C transport system permease protein
MKKFHLHPITRKRLRRFREVRYAYWSFVILAAVYLLSLGAELLCNNRPLYLRCNGKSYFPFIRFYPEDTFTGNGTMTRPDYKELNRSSVFAEQTDNFMIFPPVPYGPQETLSADQIELPDEVTVSLSPQPQVSVVYLTPDFRIAKSRGSVGTVSLQNGEPLDGFSLSGKFKAAFGLRLRNREASGFEEQVSGPEGRAYTVKMAPFHPRQTPPETVRIYLERLSDFAPASVLFKDGHQVSTVPLFDAISPVDREELVQRAQLRLTGRVPPVSFEHEGTTYEAAFEYEEVMFPFRPCTGHPMGLDVSGRDVFSRMVYGLRISLSFGLLLVFATMIAGSLVGAIQGYYAGKADLIGQRVIEVWQAIPFLYVLILMGSVFGRSFWLLLLVYGLFNWVGISYYMRAEFLNLRKRSFVEAAWGLGVSTPRIIRKHILPNALTPLITFFPFSLVSAIGVLAALDYLGFGMPPGTPSWGELLNQAQEFSQAWWLILYPSLALFGVMLLGVFVGEGLRNAFDPRQYNRLEG